MTIADLVEISGPLSISLTITKFKYIDVVKVHTIQFPEWKSLESANQVI